MVRHGDNVLLEKRPPHGIWGGLWSFPEFPAHAEAEAWCTQRLGKELDSLRRWPEVQHSFSHFDFSMQPLEILFEEILLEKPADGVMEGGRWLWYNTRSPADIGLAAPISSLIQEIQIRNQNEPHR